MLAFPVAVVGNPVSAAAVLNDSGFLFTDVDPAGSNRPSVSGISGEAVERVSVVWDNPGDGYIPQ